MSVWWRLAAPWRLLWLLDDAWGHGWEPESLCVLAGAWLGLFVYGYILSPEAERYWELVRRSIPSLF